MKNYLWLLTLAWGNFAFAGDTSTPGTALATGTQVQQQQQQSSESAAVNSGVKQEIVFTSPADSKSAQEVRYSGSQRVHNVPSVSGAPLTSSNDTCMGSSSGSVNIAGFGAGYGSTWTDKNCVMLKNSRELWNMGMRAASLTLMCNDPDNREALELTGYECAQTARDKKRAANAQALGQHTQQPQYTDPIIRARLGLPPLN